MEAAAGPDLTLTTTVILPAFNEAGALPKVLADLGAVLGPRDEVLVVDDGSTDETAKVAESHKCRLVRHDANYGKGAAVRTGLGHANGGAVVVMDADGTYPASAVPKMREMLGDHDLIRCTRDEGAEHIPWLNRLGNRVFDRLLRMVYGVEGRDQLSGLYAIRREALDQMDISSSGFDIEAEIAIKARARGLRVATVPISYQPRIGEKKLRAWRDGWVVLSRIFALILLFNPLVTFVIPGLLLLLASSIAAVVLSQGPIVTPYFGLSIHGFILVTIAAIASFQIVVFGFAATLYSVEVGVRPPTWLLRIFSRKVRMGGAFLGMAMAAVGGVAVIRLILQWIAAGAGDFSKTRPLVLASALLVWGLQILSTALFVSIFSGRLKVRPGVVRHEP